MTPQRRASVIARSCSFTKGVRVSFLDSDTVIRVHQPGAGAVAYAAEHLRVPAAKPGRQVVVAHGGLVTVDVADAFTEQLVALHWQAIVAAVDGDKSMLQEFVGLRFSEVWLATSLAQREQLLGSRADVGGGQRR